MNICKYIFSCFFKNKEESLNKSNDSNSNLSLSSQETVVTTNFK
tara:strand:+ start:79 stop:210 length:132 start_codon:yes stop_codon:yes gene_type:complete